MKVSLDRACLVSRKGDKRDPTQQHRFFDGFGIKKTDFRKEKRHDATGCDTSRRHLVAAKIEVRINRRMTAFWNPVLAMPLCKV
ncbi:MAG: hypothetical protein ACK43N_18655, partial [Pirellulaceae bacterium]